MTAHLLTKYHGFVRAYGPPPGADTSRPRPPHAHASPRLRKLATPEKVDDATSSASAQHSVFIALQPSKMTFTARQKRRTTPPSCMEPTALNRGRVPTALNRGRVYPERIAAAAHGRELLEPVSYTHLTLPTTPYV